MRRTPRGILFLNLSPITSDDAAEGEVVGASVDRMGHAGGGAVALTVVLGAGPRAPFEHLARDGGSGRVRIDARLPAAAARIDGGATAGTAHLMPCGVPVSRPLPGVADHVEEPVA